MTRRVLQQMSRSVAVLISGYDSPEGPAFDRDGNLYFVNWLSSSIVRLTPDGLASEFFNTGGIPAGLAFHRDGSLYVADEGDDIHGVLRVADGRATILVNEFEGQPPNGVALSADGTAVYLAETYHNRILRYSIEANGAVAARDDFAFLPGGEGPDGMAFDEAGNLYVAHYGGGKVAVFAPSGEMVEEILVPGAEVTNVAFGGTDRRTLVITDVETASLYRTPVDVPGLALFG